MRLTAAVILFVAAAHAALWGVLQTKQSAPDYTGMLPSVSYAPFEGTDHPDVDNVPNAERIRSDLKKLATITRAIRLYSSTGGVELVPPIAAEVGLKVTLGVWIDKNDDRNKREIASAIQLARRNSNVIGVVVGNETLFRGELKPDELIAYIKTVKKSVSVPVTTGEIWNLWRDYPELASNVDFIAAHVLPYWEFFNHTQAVDQAVDRYQVLRNKFPGKRVVIAEFGWPSEGYNRGIADPGPFQQAWVLRNFVTRAEAIGMEYNIVEGIDQPWKFFEGGVGPYWGVLNASREAKFSWTGPIVNPDYWKLATIALLVGVLLSLPIVRLRQPTVMQAMVLAITAHGVGAWVSNVFAYWNVHYFVWGSTFALTLGLILLVPLILIAMARIEEIAAIAFGRAPRRLLTRDKVARDRAAMPEGYCPKVSIHVPAYFEPVDMMKQTLDALARLDYPNYEVVCIINNTPDPAFWQPIQDHCRMLGERFKFINAEKVKGFKAGALRIAMERTAVDAEIIGIIDADYVVTPDWLSDLVPAFADPAVGLVQAPQEHRDEDLSLMHYIMNGEYAGFFDIGMVQRNEENAIIVHGTMCLIRRAAMDMAGGWSSDTICEDTDLGLAIQELGWKTHYTATRYGSGLLPDTYEAFKKQRHRWAYGGFQIVKKHWRRFLPGKSRLTADQKREFSLGWLNWLGAESLGVVVAILNLIWVPIVAFAGIAIPDKILTIPIIAAFVVSLAHFLILYRLRVAVRPWQMLGAMIAAMSVQWTVSRAVAQGLITEHLAFARTSKGGLSRMSIEFQAFWEAVIGALLLIGATILIMTNYLAITELYIFAAVLILESLPFLSAVAIAVLEMSRINSFDFWRHAKVRTAELIGLRPVWVPELAGPGMLQPMQPAPLSAAATKVTEKV
ncbi:Putative beta-(1-3)-glucosyl transferase, ndvB-like [Bradyrhizobium sp. ORS 285]|uniref:glycosyltransferase n=1 Tax=Bradyrhizobium sp. ORS 285 TaxID=115808 RepID=UPI000240A66E|nr:glycosyltransferase [Bradyrhizobium sp. ORS 285]CCD89335.1 putative beta-(1-3)-glucosyl transferase, ndvB-like [Bradyrhizobium sp. ORS 285]SMX58588.1 Putative beta-(1-3)-glucosyl transferase, ndvB-like [Bradyrhizobium sp. ORS 285]